MPNASPTNLWIHRLGETDQLSLTDKSHSLQQERINLRLLLAQASKQKEEQQYFMLQAVSLAEQSRFFAQQTLEQLEVSSEQNSNLSTIERVTNANNQLIESTEGLFRVYVCWHTITADDKYLTIAEQVIKPISHLAILSIVQCMVILYTQQKKPALTQYWRDKQAKMAKP